MTPDTPTPSPAAPGSEPRCTCTWTADFADHEETRPGSHHGKRCPLWREPTPAPSAPGADRDLDRCLMALRLEIPGAVVDDVERIVRSALSVARAEAETLRRERDTWAREHDREQAQKFAAAKERDAALARASAAETELAALRGRVEALLECFPDDVEWPEIVALRALLPAATPAGDATRAGEPKP